MSVTKTEIDRLTSGVFARARAAGVGYVNPDEDFATGVSPNEDASTGASSVAAAGGGIKGAVKDAVGEALKVAPRPGPSLRLRLAPSPRTATMAAAFLLVLALLVVGWQVLSATPTQLPSGLEASPGATLGSALDGETPGTASKDSTDSKDSKDSKEPASAKRDSATPPHLLLPGFDGKEIVVHVTGQVQTPGLVYLADPSRVVEAIEAAGGPTQGADLGALNLARLLADGEQLYVPAPGETPPVTAGGTGSPAGSGGGVGGVGGVGGGAGLVNLNTADATALETLPGIGPALAQRITEYRQQHGSFKTVDQLDEVSGIGPALLEKLRSKVTV